MTIRTSLTSSILFLGVLSLTACDSNDSNPCDDIVAPNPVAGSPAPQEVADGDYTTTANGLKYFDLLEGEGEEAAVGDSIYVEYTGWLTNGYIFDSSVLLNRPPLPVLIGTSPLILGWTEGLQGMKEGGQRQLVIPPLLAYGETCSFEIPANATLIFEVEAVNLVKSAGN